LNLAPYLEDFGPFTVGDAPRGTFPVEYTEPHETTVVGLPDDALVSAWIASPLGHRFEVPISLPDADALPDDPQTFNYPADLALSLPGIWSLVVQVNGQTIRPARFVVQAIDGWHTLDTARDEWRDAEAIADAALWNLLESARVQCASFAPPITGFPPVTYLQAQIMQARALARSMTAQERDQLGEGEFSVTVYPLDHTIRALLRPKRGTPGRI
jgi:hypothetical protein